VQGKLPHYSNLQVNVHLNESGKEVETLPTVSVLVTVYNRESYLAETLKSVLDSSWTDFELIVVDDASSDKSASVAESFAKNDKRIRVCINERNLGDYGNRAKAASLARGRYIKYVDSDDLIYKYSLASMVESLEKNPEAALALSHSRPEDDSPYPWYLTPNQTFNKHFLGRGCLSCGPSGAIIRRDAFELVGGFREQWKVLADTELWLRMASRWPTVLLPPGLIWWRRHEDQQFSSSDSELTYLERGFQLAMEALTDAECPLTQHARIAAMKKVRQHFSRRLLSLAIRAHRLGPAYRLYKESSLTLADLASGFRTYR